MIKTSFLLSLYLCLGLLLQASPGLADFQQEIGRDLQVQSAYLVAPVGETWLIDADARQGVQTGDLFTVVTKGDPIVHPVTQEVIGTLDQVIGVLRITQVKSGYSYAEVLHASGGFKPGMVVKRFANLPATFWDYTGQGEAVYAELQAALPELQWQAYAAAQDQRPATPAPLPEMAPGVLFVLTGQGLAVKSTDFQPIQFYRPDELNVVESAAAPAPPAPAPPSPPPRQPEASPAGKPSGLLVAPPPAPPTPRAAGEPETEALATARGGLIVNRMETQEGIWMGPRVEGHPVGLDIADLDRDGRNEVIMAFRDRIDIARMEDGALQSLLSRSFPTKDLLSLDVLDLDGDGVFEVYVSSVQLNIVKSKVFEFRDGQLVEIIANVPYLFREIVLGPAPTLLGQQLNPDLLDHNRDFAGPIYRFAKTGDELQKADKVSFPDPVSLYGFQPFSHQGNRLVAYLDTNDNLRVLGPEGGTIWESHEYFGGSETSFERPDGTYEATTRYVFLKPRIEPGPDQTLLIPVNEGNRTFSAFRQFRSSHLRAMAFDGYALEERWRTKPQSGYLADFRLADVDNDGAAEIAMLVMFSHGSWFKAQYGNTALVVYEIE